MYYMGIDCGTQGTKAIVFDSESGAVISKGYAKHDIISDDTGKREQNALWWIDALKDSVKTALSRAGIDGRDIRALAVSGQQHGLVLLDGEGKVLRDVKLWNDTSTASHNQAIIDELGGLDQVWDRINTALPVGFTASKVRYVLQEEPELYKKVKHILLPHDYINFYLTGEYFTEGTEASGTGYYDVKSRSYSQELMTLIDPSGILAASVPPVRSWDEPGGRLLPDVAEELGLSPETLVACGGGDNSIGAVGTAAVMEGKCTLSLGTSGTVCLQSRSFGSDNDPLIQVYDYMENRWLATACTLNATSSTTSVQELFDISVKDFDEKMEKAEIGCRGVRVIPFLNGERMPALPSAQGVIKNLTNNNLEQKNLIRATAEAVIFSLKWGFDKLLKSFDAPRDMIITGGGGNSAPWRQIAADVFGMTVNSLQSDEGGALGAALQALYLHKIVKGEKENLNEICRRYIQFDETKETRPIEANVEKYRDVYASYLREIENEWNIKM